MARKLHELERLDAPGERQALFGVGREKSVQACLAAVVDDRNIGVARLPGVGEAAPPFPVEDRRAGVAQPVHGLAQGSAPALAPAPVHAGIAAAVRAPALHAVDATPRRLLEDFRLVLRRMAVEVGGVVDQFDGWVGLEQRQAVGERHLAVGVVVAVGLAVRGDAYDLRPVAVVAERSHEPVAKGLAALQHVAEGHVLGDGAVVEKDREITPVRQAHEVGRGGVHMGVGNVPPVAAALVQAAHARGLARGQDREADAGVGQDAERFQVHGGLGQPHALGVAAEAGAEIRHAPFDLGDLVAPVGQRHDHVAVGLGQGRAVAVETLHGEPVRVHDGLVEPRMVPVQPGQQRWAEIEADLGVVVDDIDDIPVAVQDARAGIGAVAFGGDALVPVMVGVGRILDLDLLEPGVLPGRLVEMAVDADIAVHAPKPSSHLYTTAQRGGRVMVAARRPGRRAPAPPKRASSLSHRRV